MMEEAHPVLASALNINVQSIKVTAAVKNEDSLVFMVKSQEMFTSKEHHVDRNFEDFAWLQRSLLTQDEVPGLQGIIFPPLPAKPYVFQSNTQAKMIKQLGLLGLSTNWQTYSKALEKYLQQVASHTMLSKNPALQTFFTLKEQPGGNVRRKGILNRLSQALEEMTKENHKDIDEYFQSERSTNLCLTRLTKAATEKFLDLVMTQQKISLACGHLSTALHLGITQDEDPTTTEFSKLCLKLSEILDIVKKNYENVAENNLNSLGSMLDLDSRYQEAEKEMLFRRTCKLVELENIGKNLEKAKSVKKATLEETKKSVEKEFKHISDVAKLEIERFHRARVEAFQQDLTAWCESQIQTARNTLNFLTQHLGAFREHDNMK
ncbi:sorting nexin-6 [Scleropages formosus]|uniref:sorting nexin-6 n=1 Tax=Scleropages formosus TaxID=113540 RepID=UPI0008785DA7|nr:sorting nexin-6-like [Scleropages formosus]